MNILNLVLKNSLRKKTRFVLTCLSVLVAFFLLTTLAGIDKALTAGVSASNQYRLMTSHKISLTRSLPNHYQQKIKSLPNVVDVSYVSWFGGFFNNEKNQLAVMAVNHNNYFEMFTEYQIPEQQLQHWKNTRTGIVIGAGIAEKYGWKIGDKVPLNSSIWMNKSGSFTWEFIVAAIYHSADNGTDDKRVFFQHLYFDQARGYSRNTMSWLTTQIAKNADLENVSKSIDKLFANAGAATRTTSEQVFMKEQAQQFVDMAMVLKVVLSAVFFTLLLIVCNTMIQTIRERFHELAMMKALGFSSMALIKQVYFESLLLLSIGALLGTSLAALTLGQVQQKFADFLPGIGIASSHYVAVVLLVVLTALLASLFPSITIKRLNISETLGART